MTPCHVASRIMADQDIALQEAYHHREDKALLLRYAGAVGKTLDRHLQECPRCLSSNPNVEPTKPVLTYERRTR